MAKATDPSYVLVMSKASAVVTEYGRVCSHAAIVSRELGIPCIIEVESATSLLKDGMLIEVDGSAGECESLINEFLNSIERAFFTSR
ncbi:MAG: PEP-utilizing enzyme [Thermofilaceae archaeon]